MVKFKLSEMNGDINNIVEWLIYEEQNIYAVAIIDSTGQIQFQTDNWDVSPQLNEINQLINHNPGGGQDEYYGGVSKPAVGSITLRGVKYIIIENTRERKIGTNPGGQGHLVIAPVPPGGSAGLVCYVSGEISPRDVLAVVQNYALKLVGRI